ncbi:MAG: hypothetical protein ABL984_09660, partial [Pyrinomonadaceae bacterium]
MSRSGSPSEEEDIIRNSRTNTLYPKDFGGGRFFTVVFEDESGFGVKLAPKTMVKVLYIPERKNIEGLHITKLVREKEVQKLDLNKFDFQQLRAFLEFISSLDLDSIPERRISLSDGAAITPEVR